MIALLFATFSPAELARVQTYILAIPDCMLPRRPWSLRTRTRFKQGCRVTCRFRVFCTLYLQCPCAASCLCICTHMQCNVPEHCWQLQTAKFAPAVCTRAQITYTKLFPGLAAFRAIMNSRQETNFSCTSAEVCRLALLDNRRSHRCRRIFSWIDT